MVQIKVYFVSTKVNLFLISRFLSFCSVDSSLEFLFSLESNVMFSCNMFREIFVIISLLFCIDWNKSNVNAATIDDADSGRAIMFPVGSATGILVALAVPVQIPDRSVFVSYNFEANYGMPTMPSQLTAGPLNRVKERQLKKFKLENT